MSDSRTKNGMRNITAGFANKVIVLLLPFTTRTIIAYVLGNNYLGLSGLFSAIIETLNLTELGFGSALVFSMYKPIAQNDQNKINALLRIYRKIYYLIGTVVLCVGLIFIPFLPDLIKGSWPGEINIYAVYLILLSNTALSYFLFAYKKALLTAYQRSDIISNINSIVCITCYSIQIVVLLATHNYYVYILLLPLFTVAENIYTFIVTSRRYPAAKCSGQIAHEDIEEIKTHVKGIALQKICSASRNSFDSIIISAYLGLTAVALYGNYYYIMISIHAILYLIPDSIRASVGNSVASETQEKNYLDFCKFTFMYDWLSVWCCACLFCLYQPFMRLWMGESNTLPLFTVALFCLYFYELCTSDIIALYKDGAGLWWFGRYRTVIEAAANLLLNILLGRYFGINGVLIATIVTMLFLGIGYGAYIVFHHYFTAYKIKAYFFDRVKHLLIVISIVAITYGACSCVDINNNLGVLLIRAAICVLIPNIIMFLLFRKKKQLSEAADLMMSILSHKKTI